MSAGPQKGTLIKLGLAAFLVAAVVKAPASLLAPVIAASGTDLQYRELSGTIWRGRMEGAATGDQYLGDIDFQLRPLSFLTGQLAADVTATGGAAFGKGLVSVNLLSRRAQLQNADIEFDLTSVQRYSLFGIPYQGRVRGEIEQLSWSQQGCAIATGDIWTDVLDASSKRYLGDGLLLKGAMSCDGNTLRIDFKGGNREGETDIRVAVNPDMTYQVSVSVDPDRREVGENLRLLGFEDNNGVLVYDAFGALKGAGT